MADDRVRLKDRGWEVGLGQLREALDGSIALANSMKTARDAAVVQGFDRVCDTAWARAAAELGLERDGHAMRGRYRGVDLLVETRLVSWSRVTVVEVRFDAPIAGALDLSPAEPAGVVGLVRQALGLGDLRTGDDTFDARFELRAEPPALALERLDARAALLELDGRGQVHLTESSLWLCFGRLVRDPEELVQLVSEVTAVGSALAAREVREGPFR